MTEMETGEILRTRDNGMKNFLLALSYFRSNERVQSCINMSRNVVQV